MLTKVKHLHGYGIVCVNTAIGDPSIIPLSLHGVVDVDGSNISDGELMSHAFLNSITQENCVDVSEQYAYRRGSKFINEYPRKQEDGTLFEGDPDNPNHLLGCFPTLFPYGKGAFEIRRAVKVSYERHIRWALSYHDKRYIFIMLSS